jgi:hypothetical protein
MLKDNRQSHAESAKVDGNEEIAQASGVNKLSGTEA